MPYAQNHTVMSDFADYPKGTHPELDLYKVCGFQTHDEAAILFQIASAIKGDWLDIGGHTGWTAAHMSVAGCQVTALDPMYMHKIFHQRTLENLLAVKTSYPDSKLPMLAPFRSDEYFSCLRGRPISFDGIMIDGDHEQEAVLFDTVAATVRIKPTGVILFHDVLGSPQFAVTLLQQLGYKVKIYLTPHVVACCWKDENFKPPVHKPDPTVNWQKVKHRMIHIDWERVECDSLDEQ